MRILYVFISAFLVTFLIDFHAYADTGSKAEKRVIITYKNANSFNQLSALDANKIIRKFKKVHAATATLSTSEIDQLKKDPNVLSVEEDKKISINSADANWGVGDIHSDYGWNNGLTGKGINIGVMDTGIDKAHEDLTVQGGASFVDYTSDYADDNGHGTHVAGIIGANGSNNNVKGVAPDANLYSIKVLDSSGEGYVSSFIAGIDWAISQKMDILNISAGSPDDSPSFQSAIDQAYQSGILIVAAGGNDGNGSPVNYPAQYDSVIAVSAVDNTNLLASFSSTGPKIEVAAPGVNILSTCMGNTYCTKSGTSMAAPFVSGYLALLKEANPTGTDVQIRNLLDSSTVDLGSPGRDDSYGFGLISFPVTSQIANPASFNAISADNNVSLSWGTVQGANSYTLMRNGTTVYSGMSTSFSDSNVSASTTYQYSLFANSTYSRSPGISISATTQTDTPVTLTVTTPLYNNQGDTNPVAYLNPQTVYAAEISGNWYKIHTWLGDKWIQIQDCPEITFVQNTPFYNNADANGPISGYIGPQAVKSIGVYQNWFLIPTWEGNKWVKKEDVIYGPITNSTQTIRFDNVTAFYNTPFSSAVQQGALSPQTVVSAGYWNGWYEIHTWLGNKWVPGAHAITGQISSIPAAIRFDEMTKLYQAPFSDLPVTGSIGPQTLTAFESWNGWYHVHTWLGDKWVPGSHAITGTVSEVSASLLFKQVTPFYNSPFADVPAAGSLSPQTIVAFEKWNDWYHIHTWLGDKWISGQDAAISSK